MDHHQTFIGWHLKLLKIFVQVNISFSYFVYLISKLIMFITVVFLMIKIL